MILQSLTAASLVCVVIIALWGQWVRRMIYPARLSIEVLDKNGELTILDNGHKVLYYHLRVINKKSVIVHNCTIFLKKIQKLNVSGQFDDLPISVPPRYFWSPAETSPEDVDVVTERIIDFGYIIDSSGEFKPTVTPILNSFRGNLKHNETFRYGIEVVAENYRPKKLTVIEVTWDGIWPEDLNDMYRHLVIKKV